MSVHKQLESLLSRKCNSRLDNSKRGIETIFQLTGHIYRATLVVNSVFVSLLGKSFDPKCKKPIESDIKTILIYIIFRHSCMSYSELGSIFGYGKYLDSRIQIMYQLSKFRRLMSIKDKQIINLTKKVVDELERLNFPELNNREKILYNVGLSSNKTGSEISQGYF